MRGELLYDVPREQYDALPGDNWSCLKFIGKSPAHYKHNADTDEQKDSDALKMGRAVDLAVLEPEEYPKQVVVWRGGKRMGGDWKEFAAAHEGRDILTVAEAETVERIRDAVFKCSFARQFVTNGRRQVTMRWDTEVVPGHAIPCKGRLDYLNSEGILDLKTARSGSPEAFGRDAWKLSYLGQSAFYTDGYAAITDLRHPFRFLVVEKEPPFCIAVYEVTPEQMARGRDDYMQYLATLTLCRIRNEWPGYATAPMPLELPVWAKRQAEDSYNAEQMESANG